jgi:hypothetical protein
MLTLTPELCAAVYDALVLTAPFNKWNLPHSEDVRFHIIKTNRWHADHWKERYKSKHHIRMSSAQISTWHRLLVCMAHEMLHVYLDGNSMGGRRHHGLAFQNCAMLVCKHHRDFDPKDF